MKVPIPYGIVEINRAEKILKPIEDNPSALRKLLKVIDDRIRVSKKVRT